jgi:hypothetical protein
MIKANELRIGNLLTTGEDNFRVTLIHKDFVKGVTINDKIVTPTTIKSIIKPIPLTEEWLLKFGFEFDEEYNSYSLKMLSVYDGKNGFSSDLFWDGLDIETVHQLQNLYFALTNEELTIKN